MAEAARKQQPDGLIRGLPFEEYIYLDGEHATALKDLLVSPLLYYRKRKLPRVDKDALRVGRATHTATLEPDRFALEMAVWRKKDGRRGTKKHKAWVEANAGRTHLTEEQYYTATSIRDAVRSHRIASKLIAECDKEVTAIWTHRRTGIRCVSRFDLLGRVIADLKSTRNPSPRKFASDCAKLGYAMQMGMYYEAALELTGETLPVKVIAAQNTEPFDTVVFNLPDDVINIGREQFEKAIDLLIECRESGKWPGIAPDSEVDLILPAWAAGEEEVAGPDESMPIEDVSF